MSRALAAIVAIALLFLVIVYLLVMAPVMGALDDAFYGGSVDVGQGTEGTAGMIETITLRVVPALLAIVAIIFGYAAVTRRQGRRGRL